MYGGHTGTADCIGIWIIVVCEYVFVRKNQKEEKKNRKDALID